MKKNKYKICYIISIILFIGFILKTIYDYKQYTPMNSAPFNVWIMVNFISYIIPAIFFIVLGIIIKNVKRNSINKIKIDNEYYNGFNDKKDFEFTIEDEE